MADKPEVGQAQQLRRCPWCGVVPFIDDGWFDGAAVSCTERLCKVSPSTGWCDSVEEAVRAWNSRAGA